LPYYTDIRIGSVSYDALNPYIHFLYNYRYPVLFRHRYWILHVNYPILQIAFAKYVSCQISYLKKLGSCTSLVLPGLRIQIRMNSKALDRIGFGFESRHSFKIKYCKKSQTKHLKETKTSGIISSAKLYSVVQVPEQI
jgi:hypothetical protein